jgi:hypothetical protein
MYDIQRPAPPPVKDAGIPPAVVLPARGPVVAGPGSPQRRPEGSSVAALSGSKLVERYYRTGSSVIDPVMLDLLGQQLGRNLNPARIAVPSGERVEVDGADADRSILVECWAHQGPPKSAQRHKVLADAFKLTWIATTVYPRPRLILCLSDPLAAAPFLPGARSWAARAFQDLGVTISVVDLPVDLRHDLLQAQRRQYR